MLSKYRDIFSLPGAWQFSVAGLIARLPMAILGLGTVLFIQGVSGSYGTAGFVTATLMITQAMSNPVIARLVDAHGQRRIMAPVVAVHCVAVLGIIASVYLSWWFGLVYFFAGLAGLTVGSFGSLVRARWNSLATTPEQLDTAFSWEAVADEILFLTGPVVVTVLATAIFPPAGLILSLVAVVIGSLWFFTLSSTEPAPTRVEKEQRGKVLSNSGIFLIVLAEMFLGINFGSLDVISVAFAEEQGVKSLAGVLLSAFALGSLIAGAIYGGIAWKSKLGHRYAAAMTALAILMCLLVLPDSMLWMGIVMFVIGATIAPSIIGASTLMKELAPPARLTEALAWIGTAMGFGVAIGSAGSGTLIDRGGSSLAVYLPIGCAMIAALIVLVGLKRIDPARKSHAARQKRSVVES